MRNLFFECLFIFQDSSKFLKCESVNLRKKLSTNKLSIQFYGTVCSCDNLHCQFMYQILSWNFCQHIRVICQGSTWAMTNHPDSYRTQQTSPLNCSVVSNRYGLCCFGIKPDISVWILPAIDDRRWNEKNASGYDFLFFWVTCE